MTSLPKETKQVKSGGFKKLGYVRLWRGFKDDPLWKIKRKFSEWEAWEDLYMEASGTDRIVIFKKRVIKLKRGQLATSQRILAKRWNWTRGSVRNFLSKLERRQSISVKPLTHSPPHSLITFLKYDELNPMNEEK